MAGYGYTYYPYQQPIQQPMYQPPMQDQMGQLRQQQYQPMQTQQMFSQQASQQSMIWVAGEQEAMGYLIAPNSAVALWDSTAPVIYLKQADASGKPTIKIYDLVERTQRPVQATQEPAIEYAPLSRLEELEARINALSANKETGSKTSVRKAAQKEDVE